MNFRYNLDSLLQWSRPAWLTTQKRISFQENCIFRHCFCVTWAFKPLKWLWPFIILLLVLHVSPPSTGKLWRPLSTEEVTSFSCVLAEFACKHGPPSNWSTRLALRLKDRIWCVNITCYTGVRRTKACLLQDHLRVCVWWLRKTEKEEVLQACLYCVFF